MKNNVGHLLLVVFLFISLNVSGQKSKYQGKFHADESMYRGITSKLLLTTDSFELVYSFAPPHLLRDINNPEIKFKSGKNVNVVTNNTHSFPVSPGSGYKKYKGVWRVNNTEKFLKKGFDITIMHAYSYDSVESDILHLTKKDGDLLQFTYNDNTVIWGFASPNYFTSPTIFINNTVGEVYFKDEK